ncbi:FABP family protein [Propioniciclava tarda]|uniref:Ferric nitrobindin-like protein n=1 Tax=Propioniciclava tarda TaxID=433330 RepID=A0A4Q9KL91_PROTD|nr:FABP family protein [Propioniciclava tarda]TBT94670.1 FABP family protein [Propioniciclava tarda]SMO67414.1 protein of unknown function [Propioniciclava tarda]HOA88269.1 FABP family protein [Propioniciclava tarda]HQA30446.1 FABP family protein [Propioniciclava tarda]HQD60174.1 FABP family protein [Propioniciclava tarda]
MFEIPADLNPALAGLAWLRGRWEGTGYREWPGLEKTQFGQQVDFVENGGDYLHYISQTFTIDDDGRPLAPLTIETGFWRANAKAEVEVVMCGPDGYAEILYGKLQPGRVDLTSDAVIRTQDAPVAYTAGRRLYGNVDGKLMYSFDRATDDVPLRPYIWATLERR